MNKHFRVIHSVIIWLIVIVVAFVFVKWYQQMLSFGNFLIELAPVLILVIGGTLVLDKNYQGFYEERPEQEFIKIKKLNFWHSIQHDLLSYFIPFLIIILTYFVSEGPTIIDYLQAFIVFLGFNYLKLLYWGKL